MPEYKHEILDAEVKNNFNPSKEELEVVKRVYQRFLDMKRERDKPRKEFDMRTLSQYVNDSRDAYNGIVSDEIKSTKEDWQSLSWDHKTRGKVKTVVAMIVGAKPFISLIGKNKSSQGYAENVLDTYEDSWNEEHGSYKLFLQALDAAIKGTVIVEEMYVEEKVKRKEITSIDQETGQIEYTEKDVIKGGMGKVESEIVDLLEFYPNENSYEIEHDCCRLRQFSRKAFKNKYGKYVNAEYVMRGTIYYDETDGTYKEQTSNKSELIDVLFYYNEDWDEHIILANNIWINKQKGDKPAPIPFDHHKLPYAKTVFELADVKSFYGKSLPDLMRGEQDPANALERLMVDREILSLQRGFFLGAGVEIDSYELYPGSIKKLTGGNPNLPINQQIMEQPITGANQSALQMLQLLSNNSDINTSIDPTAQGVHSGRKTARESVILDENAKRNSGPFQLHVYKLLWDRAVLRVENIKQFYTTAVQTEILKDKNGTPVIDKDGNPVETGQKYREITVKKPGKEAKWFNIDPNIKGCEFHVRFIEDYEMPQSQSARIELSKSVLDEAKANPLINADNATIDWLTANRKNPDDLYIKPKPQAVAFQNGQDANGIPPMNAQPPTQ